MTFTLWPCEVTFPGSGRYCVDLSSWWWDSTVQSTSVNLKHWIVSSWQKPPLVYIMSQVKVKSLSRVRLFATPWTVAYQAPLSVGFSRQEYWSGLPLPSPWNLPDPGIEPRSLTLQADSLPSKPPGKPYIMSNLKGYFIQHRQYSQYFIVTINRAKTLKIVNHCSIYL